MERKVKCAQCQRANVSASDICEDCRRALQAKLWRRFAAALMRDVEPEGERTLH
jgi:hypothetical protein